MRRSCPKRVFERIPNAAREAWILATLPRTVAYATSLLADRTLGEDVVHDCYVRLLEKADTYDLLEDGTKLLYKSITNACIDRNYRDRRLLSLEVEHGADPGAIRPGGETRCSDPQELAAHRELEEAVAIGLCATDGGPAQPWN